MSLADVIFIFDPGEEFAGSVLQLPLPAAHRYGVDGVVVGDLLGCLLVINRLHGGAGPELMAMDAALAHLRSR